MKTPREILLERHENIAPKLDAIRQMAVAAVCDRRIPSQINERRSQAAATIWQMIWRELIFPSRRIWAGLAAIWILLFIVNFSLRDKSELMARKNPSPEMILTYRQQEKLLAELVGPNELQVAEPPKTFPPRPSSERQIEIFVT